MAFKGKVKEQKPANEFVKELYTGFGVMRVVAVNPTRAELNKIFGREEKEDAKELAYLEPDSEGKERLRLAFWLHNEENDKYFVQNLKNIYNEPRISKTGDKIQMINSTCDVTWVPLLKDAEGNYTDKPDESLLPEWFTTFTSKEKEVLGKKKYRVAIRGEEQIANLLKAFISMDWYDPETEVLLDTKRLFQENLKEMKDVIFNDKMCKTFTALLGVRTDDKDVNKKYQEIHTEYLPAAYMTSIKKGNKFTTYTQGIWDKFTKKLEGKYGFNCYHKLAPLSLYNEKADPVASNAGKPEVSPADNEY